MGGWLTGVTAAAILCALAERLMPEGAVRRVGKLALSLVMLFAMVRPWSKFRWSPRRISFQSIRPRPPPRRRSWSRGGMRR